VADAGFRLGIDFGTSNTVAVLRWPDGRSKPLLFDGSPLLPSAVYVDPSGSILTGRDAVHSARLQPHRFEPYPKRRVEEGNVWLGEQEIPVVDLVATVLRRVGGEAYRVAGTMPTEVNITHPAAWAPQRRETLSRAALAAELPAPFLTAEPIAAASYFVGTVGTPVPVGGNAVVYDFGAGTFDASVVRRNATGGFDVLSSEGLPDAGGLDVDAAVVGYLGRAFEGRGADLWLRLTQPQDENDRRAAWQLWEDARLAKEMLSRAATTYVHVPLFDESVVVGREQLEELARPILDRTVVATQLAVSSAGITNQQLAALFLVGGSSRIPLAATLLHRALGLAPTAIEQPELVVAEGALFLAPPTGRARIAGNGVSPVSGVPVSGTPSSGMPQMSSGTPQMSSGTPQMSSGTPQMSSGMPQVSSPPTSGSPYTTPSNAPGLPPLMPTGQFQAAPPPPPPPPPTPVSPTPHYATPVPPTAWPPPPPTQVSTPVPPPPPPPGWQSPGIPVSPSPVSGPQVSPAGPYTMANPASNLSQATYPPVLPPPTPRKRGGFIAMVVGAGVLAVLLAIGLVIVAIKTTGSPGGGNSPTPNPLAGGASPACGYKLAYLGVLTGDNAADGVTIRDSAKLAIDQYNGNHGNCKVSLAEFDTQRKDDLSATVAQQVVEDPKILGVIGPVYRSEVLAATPVLEQAGVPLVSPAASDEELSRKGWKVFHRVLGTDADQAVAGAQYLKTIAKASKTYIVYDDTEFGTTASAEVRRRLGDLVVGEVAISRTATDYSAAVKQVTDAGADSVYFAGFFDDGGVFVKALKTAAPKITVVSGDKIFTQSFIDAAGSTAEGVVITCPCIPAEQAGDNFAAKYKQKYSDTASYYGPEAYDATNIFLAGLNAGKSTRADMLAFVNAYSGRGISRDIKFTVSGDLDVSNLQIWAYKVQGGYVEKDQAIPPG
jgi:ABC-type branched-subunit amino acid transport system substrate-binding protein